MIAKALSLWQPWAHFIWIGAKLIETRSWPTRYRGPLLIHAAKKRPTREIDQLCLTSPFFETLGHNRPCEPGVYYPENWAWAWPTMQWGAIIARCNLVDCVPITADNVPGGNERHFGDYTPGRFAWNLADVVQIEPVPCVGRQGLFNVDFDALRREAA